MITVTIFHVRKTRNCNDNHIKGVNPVYPLSPVIMFECHAAFSSRPLTRLNDIAFALNADFNVRHRFELRLTEFLNKTIDQRHKEGLMTLLD